MTTFASFEEMNVWQESRRLTQKIREICKRSNTQKDCAFVDQITRASRSIASNIAEGNESSTIAEFIRFLVIAKRSAAEVRAHLYDALEEQYISREEFVMLSNHSKKICGMLAQLIRYLQNCDLKRRRIKPVNPQTRKPANP